MRRGERLLTVPLAGMVLFALVYLACASVLPLVRWHTGAGELRFPPWRGPDALGATLLPAAAVLLGLYRALAYHPSWDGEYRNWLRATPWTGDQPLPLQPVHLVWRDLFPVAGLALLALRHPELHPAQPVAAFGFAYLLATANTLWRGGAKPFAVALLAGLPVALLPGVGGWWAVAVPAALYPFARVGTQRVLVKLAADITEDHAANGARDAASKEPAVGWPFQQLAPVDPPKAMSVGGCLLLSVLVGWWVYAPLSRLAVPAELPVGELLLPKIGWLIAVPIAAIRTLRYLRGFAPPIGVIGRITSGRLIVPGYDQIFVAPACVLLVGLELPRLLAQAPVGFAGASAILLTVALFLGTAIGPTLAHWQLTGTHRLVRLPPPQQAQARPTNGPRAAA